MARSDRDGSPAWLGLAMAGFFARERYGASRRSLRCWVTHRGLAPIRSPVMSDLSRVNNPHPGPLPEGEGDSWRAEHAVKMV